MSPTPVQSPLRRHWRIIALAAAILVTLVGGIVGYSSTRPDARQIAIFDGGVPGSPEALAALQYAHDADIDVVINYSSINAPRDATTVYLDDAHRLGVKVIISVKDLLGPDDLDPTNFDFHKQYGLNNNAQVHGIVDEFDGNDAVWGYYHSDELPAESTGPDGLGHWIGPLQQRYEQIHSLSEKPTIASVYNSDSPSFLKQVAGATDHLMMDYYPYPEGPGQSYGTVPHIKQIAAQMKAAAGDNSWFAIQGFSYYVSEPDMITQFGFPITPPADSNNGAPNAAEMTKMAQLALQGGVRHLAFFSFPYANVTIAQGGHPSQLDEIKTAVQRIRALPEWN